MTAAGLKKAYRKKEAMEGPEKGESMLERKMLKKGGVVKKQTGGKLPMKSPGVTKEKPRPPIANMMSGVDVKDGYKLYNYYMGMTDYSTEDSKDLWKGKKYKGSVKGEGECYDKNGKRMQCPRSLQKKRTGGATKRCPKCGMTKCKC